MQKVCFTAASFVTKKQIQNFQNNFNFLPRRNFSTQNQDTFVNPLKNEERTRKWLLWAGVAVLIVTFEPYTANIFLDRKRKRVEKLSSTDSHDYTVLDKIRRMTLRGRAATENISKSDKILERVTKGLFSPDIGVQQDSLIALQRIIAVSGKEVAPKINEEVFQKLLSFAAHPNQLGSSILAQMAINGLLIVDYDRFQGFSGGILIPKERIYERTREYFDGKKEFSLPLFDMRMLSRHVIQSALFGFVWGAARWAIALKRGRPILPDVSVLRGAILAATGAGAMVVINEPLRIFKIKVLDMKNENTLSFVLLNMASLGIYAASLYFVLGFAPYSFVPSLFSLRPIPGAKDWEIRFSIDPPSGMVVPKRVLLAITK